MAKLELTPEEQAIASERAAQASAERKARQAAPAPEPPVEAEAEPEPMQMTEYQRVAEPEEFEEPVLPAPEPLTDFDIFLSLLSEEARELLSDEELHAMFLAEIESVREEKRKVLRQQARDRARSQARAAAGLVGPGEAEAQSVREKMARRVKAKIEMPYIGDGVAYSGVVIDGVMYAHNQTHTMPLGRALDIRHALYCMHQNDMDFAGKGRRDGLRQSHLTNVNVVRI